MKTLLVAGAIALSAIGCSAPGKINAEAIDELVTDVTARHDAYVQADPSVDADKKASFLQSSALLRKVVAEAKAAKAGTAPSAPATK